MKSTLGILVLLLFVSSNILIAQPEPCDSANASMTSLCEDACIVCDIDGFTGRHEGDIQNTLPDGFCTNVQHNGQWIAFIAGSIDLAIELTTSNCDLNVGLEIGIYESFDCVTHRLVSQCFGAMSSISPGVPTVFNNTVPLVIGQYYYLAMDGGFGDNCDWSFKVVEGSTQVVPLTETSPIEGVTTTCPDLLQSYITTPEEGATIFDWTLDGQTVGDNLSNEIDLTFGEEGIYELCVTARNVCDEATPTCLTIQVITLPTTIIEDVFCIGDCYVLGDTTLCEGGNFSFNFPTAEGCDSIVFVSLEELTPQTTNLAIDICEGDTIYVGDAPFTTTGIFEESLLTSLSCDSTVILDLFTIVCLIQSDFLMTPVICQGTASGILDFAVQSGTPPFTYEWQHLQTQDTGSGNIIGLGDEVQLSNLLAGTYIIGIADQFGNQDILIAEVTEPPVLSNTFITSDYNGYQVSCSDSTDGSVSANPLGGVPPYSYNWSTGAVIDLIDGLSADTYEVTIIDNGGCTIVQNVELSSPSEITVAVDFQNPNCDGLETGVITLISVDGGIEPYVFALDDGDYSDQITFENLSPSTYTYYISDANGCELATEGTLVAPDIPMITVDSDITIALSESTLLEIGLNDTELDSVAWAGPELSCNDCLEPIAQPVNDTNYTLTVTSVDGCIDVANINVKVDKFRELFIPNIFNPNLDGENGYFNLFGGVEVDRYDLTIVDRWGNILFKQSNLAQDSFERGWDGSFNGQPVNSGVYVWVANVHFIDGVDIQYSGDITLIR